MGSEVESLKLAFSTNTTWAEWSTLAVFVGLLGDILVILVFDLFDKDKSWTEIFLAGVASLVIAVGVYGEYKYGGKATAAATRLQSNSEHEIARLNEQAKQLSNAEIQARRDIAKSDERAATAGKAAAEANKVAALARDQEAKDELAIVNAQTTLAQTQKDAAVAQEKLQATNLQLEKMQQPRRVPAWIGPKLDPLKKYAGTNVAIASVPDLEALRLAADIFGLLKECGWNATITVEPLDAALEMSEGVRIVQPIKLVLDPVLKPFKPDFSGQGFRAGMALREYLDDADVRLQYHPELYPPRTGVWPQQFNPPPDAVVIFVGMRVSERWGSFDWFDQASEKQRQWFLESLRRNLGPSFFNGM